MSKTEQRNPNTTHIDKMTSLEMAEVMQQENLNAALAVGKAVPQIAEAIEEMGKRINQGGRIFYTGCGTSGRLGVLDASECPPTYGVPAEMVVGIIAGGDGALRKSAEGAEDDAVAGRADLAAYNITPLDSVVGLSVAGNAAYVVAALEYAKEIGALAVAIACNEDCKINKIADIAITPDTGAEVVTGSTRMKAGTAQKMILNMLSTGVMIKYGRVYENFMVHVKPVNIKLRARCISIVQQIVGCSIEEAEQRLEANNWEIRDAVEKSL
ncbi:MAG: N-acetylmuramic acid 6-phosphate etherase [Clostridia bacterium]|nr:N-acetylmuramic acid 6-phosphate etherase [Clostridia bacterium]